MMFGHRKALHDINGVTVHTAIRYQVYFPAIPTKRVLLVDTMRLARRYLGNGLGDTVQNNPSPDTGK